MRTNVDPGTGGGLVPRQEPDNERQQEAEDPVPVEQIQDKTENDQDPDDEEDDVKHGGRRSPTGIECRSPSGQILPNYRDDPTNCDHDRCQTVAEARLALDVNVRVTSSSLWEMRPRNLYRCKERRMCRTVCRVWQMPKDRCALCYPLHRMLTMLTST